MIWLTIFVMTAIIFTSRYVFLEPRLPIRLSARARSLLSFSGPAVMTALWAPIVFIQTESWLCQQTTRICCQRLSPVRSHGLPAMSF